MPTCRLCEEDKALCESHYLPAAFYKSLVRSNPGHHPVLLSEDIAIETSKQITDRLLCLKCEDRFNRRGEAWVLANGWQADGVFPLRDTLRASSPADVGGGMEVYDGDAISGISRDHLVYFAASVFWRGSQKWRGIDETVRLRLGPYEEELRLFLLDKAEFPQDCSIVVGVSASEELRLGSIGIFPYLKNRFTTCRQYSFSMMGLMFDLHVGKGMDNVRRQMCLHRGFHNPIFLAKAVDAALVDGFGRLMRTARPVGKLLK